LTVVYLCNNISMTKDESQQEHEQEQEQEVMTYKRRKQDGSGGADPEMQPRNHEEETGNAAMLSGERKNTAVGVRGVRIRQNCTVSAQNLPTVLAGILPRRQVPATSRNLCCARKSFPMCK
jgi:hypothetical protein